MKNFRQAAVLVVLGLVLVGAVVVGMGLLAMASHIIQEVPWVAGGLIFLGFLIALIVTRQPGWTGAGTMILVGAVLAGALLDNPGNPIMYAPIEAVFLEPGQSFGSRAVVETMGGETHISARGVVLDADGSEVGPANLVLIGVYRAVFYFIFYSSVLTAIHFAFKALPKSPSEKPAE